MTKDPNPSISILLPTFNGEHYLAEQLDSILGQTFRDFELLVIDDGSTDHTRAILADYAARDHRMKILPPKYGDTIPNRGQKHRLIELLQAARGAFIAFSDQDDVWELTKMERLVASLGDGALAFGRSDLIDADGRPFNRSLLEVNRATREVGSGLSILFRPQVSGHAMLARREIVVEDSFRSIHPYDWLISLNAEFSQGVVYDDTAVVYHRIHGANSHNGSVLTRLNLFRVRPRDLVAALKRVRGRRLRLVEGLEFLATSALVPEERRAAFRDLADQCRTAWLGDSRGIGWGGMPLRRRMLDTLRPLAGSGSDWRGVVDHVTALTLGLFHPLTLLRIKRLL